MLFQLMFICLAARSLGLHFSSKSPSADYSDHGFSSASFEPPRASAIPARPYKFRYNTADYEGNQQYRIEHGDAENTKMGTYGYREINGIFRHVNYIADRYGFRVVVNTNEPGTAAMDAADAVFNAAPIKVLPVKAPKNLLAAQNVWYRGLTKEYGGRYGFRTSAYTEAAAASQAPHQHEDFHQSQDPHLSEYDYYEE